MREYNGENVTIMLCSQCNNNCKHCYVKYSGRFSDEELSRIIPILNQKYNIHLNGTEPILFPEYFKYFKMVGNHRIITNGIEILENPNIIEQLKEFEINKICMSYHFGIQDDISRIVIKELNELIKKLKEKEFAIDLMCSLSNQNYKNVLDYCMKAKELGVNSIRFTNFINQGNANSNFDSCDFLNRNQIDYVLDKVDIARSKIPKDSLLINRCGTFGPHKNKTNFSCPAGISKVVMTPDKKIYACVFDISEETCIGYMDDDCRILVDDDKIDYNKSYCKVLQKYNGVRRY